MFIFQIDLQKQEVTTIAGTGKQGNDKFGGGIGTEQELSSPWDVVIGPSPGNVDSLFIFFYNHFNLCFILDIIMVL